MTEINSAPMATVVKANAGVMTFAGIATILLGMLSMGAPLATGMAAALLVGILVVAAGIAEIFCAFHAGSWGRGIFIFLIGGLTVLWGGAMIANPLLHLGFLTLLMAGYFLVQGILEVVYAFRLKPDAGWGMVLFSGIISAMLGLMIWRQWPLSGAWAIGVLVGVKLVFFGFAIVSLGSAARVAANTLTEPVT